MTDIIDEVADAIKYHLENTYAGHITEREAAKVAIEVYEKRLLSDKCVSEMAEFLFFDVGERWTKQCRGALQAAIESARE